MAGSGNIPKGAKERSLLVNGDPYLQNRFFVVTPASPYSAVTLNGGAATDWFYLSGGSKDTRYVINGGVGIDWVSFQSFNHSGATYDNFSGSGITINLGRAFTDANKSIPTLSANELRLGNDSVVGSVSNVENVWGSRGNDVIVGSSTANELHGGSGNDKIFGVAGNDLIYGEAGDDILIGGSGNVSFNGGDDNDVIQSARGNDWIDGGTNRPISASVKTFSSGDPNQNIASGGVNIFDYGDTLDYSYLPAGWTVRLVLNGSQWVEATIRDEFGRVRERDKVRNIENITGGVSSDPVIGDNNGNLLDGGGGDDTIKGGGGDDLILGGGGGNDDIDGGDGTDELSFVPVTDPFTRDDRYSPANNKLNDDKSLVLDLRLDGGRGRYSLNTIETSAQSNQPTLSALQSSVSVTAVDVDNPWRSAMSSIENITGTEKNDQIAGTLGVNVINGYDGDDIIYGAGGNDTMRGGEGDQDWVLFRDATIGNQPKYTDNLLNVDPVVLKYRDTDPEYAGETLDGRNPYRSGGIVRLDLGTYSFTNAAGEITSLENVLGSTGKDFIVGSALNNVLVGEGDVDTIYAGDGSDRIYGGDSGASSVSPASSATPASYNPIKMNSLWGGSGADTFFVGFNYNPVVGTAKLVSVGENVGAENTFGALPTDASETDFGIIRIDGSDSSGSFNFHDTINDWQTGDALFLAKDWTSIITGLGASDGSGYVERFFDSVGGAQQANYDWSGGDTVDLRSVNGSSGDNENKLTSDFGKIVVLTGAGDDVIYGSNGNDWIYAGGGHNLIDLGLSDAGSVSAADGADRVFITDWSAQYEVRGFDALDSIYISQQMLDGFFTAAGFAGYSATGSGYNVLADSAGYVGDNFFNSAAGAYQTGGQAYSEGPFLFPTSGLVWNAAYKDALGDYYSSNGAWGNYAHFAAEVGGTSAVSALAYGYLATANGLVGIPFVGPILAIPFYVFTGLTIADAVINSDAHYNPTYNIQSGAEAGFGTYITQFDPGVTQTSSLSGWDSYGFLSFFNIPPDSFTKTLEITSTNYNFNSTTYTRYSEGVSNLVTIFNGTETFIYLVFSKDYLIQESEVLLLAQVNGHVTANQLVVYDADTDPYNAPVQAPVFPTEVSSIAFKEDGGADVTEFFANRPTGLAAPNDVLTISLGNITKDTTPDIVIGFDTISGGLKADETIRIFSDVGGSYALVREYVVGDASDAGAPNAGDTSLTYTLDSGLVTGEEQVINVYVEVESVSGFTYLSQSSTLKVDLKAPSVERITVTEAGLTIDVSEEGDATLGSLPTEDTQSQSTSFQFTAQGSKTTIDSLVLQDLIGNADTISAGEGSDQALFRKVALGTNTSETISESSALTGVALYGFDGDDSMLGGTESDYLFGGDGNDTLKGNNGDDFLYAGAGDDVIEGGAGADLVAAGAGADTITGGSGIDQFSFASGDSTSSVQDEIRDFSGDLIVISGSIDSNFSIASNVSVSGALYEANLDANAATKELSILVTSDGSTAAFASAAAAQAATALNLQVSGADGRYVIGGVNSDTISGGDGSDTIKGGAGDDILSGGSGAADMLDLSDNTSDLTFTFINGGAGSVTGGVSGTDNYNGFEGVIAGSGNDAITGSSAADIIDGGSGNDTITGGAGADTLTGGLGADDFVFSASSTGLPSASNFDVIADFGSGDAIDFGATPLSLATDGTSGLTINADGLVTSGAATLSDFVAAAGGLAGSAGACAAFAEAGSTWIFISDGVSGLSSSDVLIKLDAVTASSGITLSGGNIIGIA